MPLGGERARALADRLARLGIREEDLRETTQGANRIVARDMLANKIEEAALGRESARRQETERIRRQKRRRSRRAKQRMLAGKHAQAAKKALRGAVRDEE